MCPAWRPTIKHMMQITRVRTCRVLCCSHAMLADQAFRQQTVSVSAVHLREEERVPQGPSINWLTWQLWPGVGSNNDGLFHQNVGQAETWRMHGRYVGW